LLLAAACSPLPSWLDVAAPGLSVEVLDRGVVEVGFRPPALGPGAGPAGPDVRYATAPPGEAGWAGATAVTGPWTSRDGGGRLHATVRGLRPLTHHFEARVEGLLARPRSAVLAVLPLREAILDGRAAEAFFGHTVAMVGDVDGDGFADLLVGAPWSDEGLEPGRPRYARWLRRGLRALRLPVRGGKAGAAFVFPGARRGVSPTPRWTILGQADGEFLGSSVAGLGDLNRDGHADIAVGVPGRDTGLRDEGAVLVYHGRRGPLPPEPDLVLVGRTRDESFGAAVAGAGDLDGDGHPDWAIGAPGSNLGAPNGGAVFVRHGGPARAGRPGDTTLVGRTFDGLFGSALAGVGDVNGDGYADLLVGAYEGVGDFRASGAAYLYYGGPGGPGRAPDRAWKGLAAGDQFGSVLAALGDVDGDGFPDFAVAAPKHGPADDERGAVYIFHGGPRGPDPSPRTVLHGPWPGARLGTSLAGAGDQDGDGFADLLVGATNAVFLFRGGPQGIRPEPAFVLRGTHAGARLGQAVAGGQDLDGDGVPDLAIGAGGERRGGRNAGSVFVRY
jgi:hypothetical protein